MLKTQVLEQGIFREGNAFFRGWDLALENGTYTGLGTRHCQGGKCLFSGVGFGFKKWKNLQVWEQGIVGVENAFFRGWDLALENGTCTGLGTRHFRGGKCPFSGVGFGFGI